MTNNDMILTYLGDGRYLHK